LISYFEDKKHLKIILDYRLDKDDDLVIEKLFKKPHISSYEIVFNRMYSIDATLLDILYTYTHIHKKNISIITHKYRLHRYLKLLSIKNRYVSLISKMVKYNENIDVLLIGGSADSTSKIIYILSRIDISDLVVVVVQHIDAKKETNFDKILSKSISKEVVYAKNGMSIEKSKIYLAPKNRHLKVSDSSTFILDDSVEYNFARPSISISYESFSNHYKHKLMILQECGYEADGVDKLDFVKRNKSMILMQDESECKAKPMVLNALHKGVEDYKFTQIEITKYINFVKKTFTKDELISYLLVEIKNIYSYDFTLYKQNLVQRRLEIFRLKNSIDDMKKAVEVILYNKSAFKGFFLELSINVTELFRNPKSFDEIRRMLFEYYDKDSYLKIWSAGCSSGEEVYSMAILLEKFDYLKKSIIYATDFNSVVIDEAKNGLYPKELYLKAKENIKNINLDICLDSYVQQNNDFVKMDNNIRSKVHFFTHNLAIDGSFNEFDIIICKNVIIYFDDILLNRVFELIYSSLKAEGHLVLGESESIPLRYQDRFERCSQECKIYKKVV
jgi:chemotaxis protein methyltransferase CheR